MRVTIKLGSTLRAKAPHFSAGEGYLEVEGSEPVTVGRILDLLGIRPEEVNLIYRNHRLVSPSATVRDGDSLAVFPPNFIHFSQFYLKREGE